MCEKPSQTGGTVESAVDSTLPGPQRATAAAARVEPELRGALEKAGLEYGAPVFLRAFKEERVLEVFVRAAKGGKFRHFRSYRIAGMSGKLGPKLAEGDGQVPEGFYHFTAAAMKPDSAYHLAFNIGFPNDYDRALGRTGSFIMVHGSDRSIGCLAMTDAKIEEIYTLCDAAFDCGQEFIHIHVFPFRMTSERVASTSGQSWEAFWLNLKEGYDFFETHATPPDARVVAGRYVFRQP